MATGIIILPISVVEELIQLKTAFDARLKATDFVSETPSYLHLSDRCKEHMIALQSYMFRSIDQKGTELRRYYQHQTVLQVAGKMDEYAAMKDDLEVSKVENHRVLKFISDETTRAGRLLMAVGMFILRIQEMAESPEAMQSMVAEEVKASEEAVEILR
ncbi:hypothetical protein EMPG_17039 [Blastomyces silverae]|uniref:Uncharacterized protein n=1 Tax=Blastomyces silverae TaxID=2060906 RepID=A0A0H1B7R2_9EURO|nr:hypothetical protein EMPG_17039 [Blastomyces silverae]